MYKQDFLSDAALGDSNDLSIPHFCFYSTRWFLRQHEGGTN